MQLSESDRNQVYQALTDLWAPTVADLVMELLFTQPTTELVTQQDLHANTVLLRGEMAELRAELKGEMAELRGELAELRGDFKSEIGNLYRWGAGVMMANGVAVITALLT